MFYKLKNPQKKTGEETVMIIYRDSEGKEVQRSTGVSVKPIHFDTKSGKVNSKDKQNVEKNEAIAKVTRLFETVERELKRSSLHGHTWQFKKLLAELEEGLAEHSEKNATVRTFYVSRTDTIRNQIERLEKLLAAKKAELAELEDFTGTSKKENTNHLFNDKYLEYRKYKERKGNTPSTLEGNDAMAATVNKFRPSLTVEEIDLELLNELQDDLIAKGRYNSYIKITLIRLQAFYKWAAKQLNLDTSFLADFTVVKPGKIKNNIFLTETELEAFGNVELESIRLQKAREIFLFACETGLRFGDYQFSMTCIQDETYETRKGELVQGKVLRFGTEKTESAIAVPLSQKALDILERNNYQFDYTSESSFNRALKRIGKLVPELNVDIQKSHKSGTDIKKIPMKKWEALTSHIGRKTFINLSLAKGITPMTVAQWVGHADISMIQVHYADKPALAKLEAYKIL